MSKPLGKMQKLQGFFNWFSDRFFTAHQQMSILEKSFYAINLLIVIVTMAIIAWNSLDMRYPVMYNLFLNVRSIQCFFLSYIGIMLRSRYPMTGHVVFCIAGFIATVYNLLFAINICLITPFPLIQNRIFNFDNWLHFHQAALIAWANKYPLLIKSLNAVYHNLIVGIAATVIFIIATQDTAAFIIFMCAALISSFIGYFIYFFWPAFPPISVIHSPHLPEGTALIIKRYQQLHHYISDYTSAPGLIAFPSFHVTYSWICLYALRKSMLSFIPFAIFTAILTCSTVLLGWHFLADVIAGIILASFSYWLAIQIDKYSKMKKAAADKKMPVAKT